MTKLENNKNFGPLNWLQNFQKDDKDLEHVRWLLSGNPNTPASVLDDLANNEDSIDLLERLAENPHTNPDTLSRLARHDHPRIRAAVAENPQMSEKIMGRLANDIHPDVRLRLAGSYFLPRSILQILAEDDNPYVQLRAKKTIDRLNKPLIASLSLGCC